MIKVFLALVFISILVIPSLSWWFAQRPVPVLEGVGELGGLAKPVLVKYDSRAIPYIKAESDEDLYAAQGYVVARERLFQMDMLRRQANGRMAEVFGITSLPADRLMRTIGFERLAEEELKNLSSQARSALDAYTRGVNAYLAENSDKLSLEFSILGYKPGAWRSVDSISVMKYLAYELDESWKLDEFRWRVTNAVGDNMASRLFDDDLSVSSWSPEIKVPANLPRTLPASGKPAPGAGLAPAGRTPLSGQQKNASGGDAGQQLPASQGSPLAPALPSAGGQNLGNLKKSFLPQKMNDYSYEKEALFNPELSKKLLSLQDLPATLRRPDRSWGSTGFVLASSFCKSGMPMLAADKHSALTSPPEFFLCVLSSSNQHVAGAALPGVPGIIFGRNENIAWASSSLHADVQDLFVEHFANETDNKYKTLEKVETAKEFREVIPVRFGNAVEHKISLTKHGPVLLRDKDSAIALSWTGSQTGRPWLNSIIALNKAADYASFNQALSSFGGSPQLFLYADKRGASGCHAAGLIPIRGGGAQGTGMSEGWLARGEWIGYIEHNDLPQSFFEKGAPSKAQGNFCIAAGQKILSAPAAPGHFAELWGHQWDPPYRANRLALSLPRAAGAQKLDLFDFNAYQGDELNMLAGMVVAELKKSSDAVKSIDASQREALDLMLKWDGNLKRDSAAASCYESFVVTLARRLLEPKLNSRELTNEYFQRWPLWISFVENYLRSKPKDFLPPGERLHDTFMVTTFAKSNTRLREFFKESSSVDNWKWEKVHLARFASLGLDRVSWLKYFLDIKDVGVGGDANCLNSCDIDMTQVSGAFKCKNGPSVRLLVDMSDNDAFYGNLSLGQSGHYFSNYRQDQLKSWLKSDPLPIAFSDAQIEKQCRQKFYLSSTSYRY